MLKKVIRILNSFIPKRRNGIVFMSVPDYCDNPKIIFEYLRAKKYGVRMIWLIEKNDLVRYLTEQGVPAVRRKSILGLVEFLRARIIVTSHTNSLSMKCGAQILLNLWHGIGPKTEPSKATSTSEQLRTKDLWKSVDYSITTSRAAVPHYFEFFDLPEDRVKFFGYARHEFLSKKRDDHEYALSLRHNLCSDKVLLRKKWILLAPTYREEGRDLNDEELQMINKTVQDNGGLLMLRAHPVLGKRIEANHRGIVDVTSIRDITEYLPAFDGLVTDYSSIAYDFAVLRKPMVFYLYDYEEMDRIRGLNFACPSDYPGHVAFNAEELELGLIEVMNGNSKNIDPVLKKFYPPDIENACTKTTEFIMSLIRDGDSHE